MHIEPSPAPVITRILAYFFDFTLIFVFALLIQQNLFSDGWSQGQQALREYEALIVEHSHLDENGTPKISQALAKNVENLMQSPATQAGLISFFNCFGFLSISYWITTDRLLQGSTLGKMIFFLRAVDYRTGLPCSLAGCIIRAFSKTLPMLHFFLYLSYFMAFFGNRRMAGHDFISKTMVTQDPVKINHSLKEFPTEEL